MTTISTPAPVPDPLASDFGSKCYDFTVWQAQAAVEMNAVAGEVNDALNASLLGTTSSSVTSLTITAIGTSKQLIFIYKKRLQLIKKHSIFIGIIK